MKAFAVKVKFAYIQGRKEKIDIVKIPLATHRCWWKVLVKRLKKKKKTLPEK